MQNLAAMKTALRVLTAIVERQNPNAVDVEELRQYSPSHPNAPPDELACEVIQEALKKRAAARHKSAGAF